VCANTKAFTALRSIVHFSPISSVMENSSQISTSKGDGLSSKPSCSEQRRVIDFDLNEPKIDSMASPPLIPISQVLFIC